MLIWYIFWFLCNFQGWNDLKFLAINYQRIFPDIMENIYDPKKFLFRYTNTQRTEASFKAFAEGLFGENAYQHIQVPTPSANNDTLLRVRTIDFFS